MFVKSGYVAAISENMIDDIVNILIDIQGKWYISDTC